MALPAVAPEAALAVVVAAVPVAGRASAEFASNHSPPGMIVAGESDV